MDVNTSNQYYVYVYIDPRSLREFYYGKGCGNRRFAHLRDDGDSEKAKLIREILDAGLKPIVRVVAKGLTEDQALLVEKTLIWKLGHNLSNIASGHFRNNFRPHETLHKEIFGFDYENTLYYVNVGEGEHRCWEDCRKFGFLSAGQDWEKWGRKLYVLEVGDIVAAYLKGRGYVGIGKVTAKAITATDFRFKGVPLGASDLSRPKLLALEKGIKDSEHLVAIEWIRSVSSTDAKWKTPGIYSTPLVVASLENQTETISFLEKAFDVNFDSLFHEAKEIA